MTLTLQKSQFTALV